MNIWCISKYACPPKYSKFPARLFWLSKEFIKQGHTATLFTSDATHLGQFPETKENYNFEIIDDVPVHWIKTKKYKKTASISRVLSWFSFEWMLFRFDTSKIEKPDVIIVSSLSIFSIIYGYFLKKKYGSFLVFEIRDIWPLTMTEEANFSKIHPLVIFIGMIEKFGYKVADLIVGTMPRLDLHVKEILGYERPFHCSPLGFNSADCETRSLQNENKFDSVFPKKKMIVGYAGSMGVTNALKPFIKTIQSLKENPDIHFMLVGSGDLRAGYEQDLSGCENVTFLPRIPQNDIKYSLAKCDVLFLSTKNSSKVWDYGQSMNKVVEYMLAGKPIIASYAGYPSMINEAECGKFVKPLASESIEESMKNAFLEMAAMSEDDRIKFGLKGQNWIRERREYSKLAQLYLEAIENTKREALKQPSV